MGAISTTENKLYIAYRLDNNGYSLGINCTECLPKVYNNAKIFGYQVSLEEQEREPKDRVCVFCGDPKERLDILYSSYDMDD